MQKELNRDNIVSALFEEGITQKQLAEQIGVSSQAITNWLKGKDFPRPPALLKLSKTLKLKFDELTIVDDSFAPVIAFRKKGSSKTTEKHKQDARRIGNLLKPLVPFIEGASPLRTLITSPSLDYEKLQAAAHETRTQLGIGESAVLNYSTIISGFKESGAVIVPAMWGPKEGHKNAVHIRLPKEDLTFIYLNLDTKMEDFKFWMAHELAHVLTPQLCGKDEGEDYADAFAGALLFPSVCASSTYTQAIKKETQFKQLAVFNKLATSYSISVNTVYEQVLAFARANDLPPIIIDKGLLHGSRNKGKPVMVSETLYNPLPADPETFISSVEREFKSDFFLALRRMIKDKGTGPGYLKSILDVPMLDAEALHRELSH